MANPQLSTRVKPEIYQQVLKIETDRQINRADVVRELIEKGLASDGITVTTPPIIESAKNLATNLQSEIRDLKMNVDKWKQRAKACEDEKQIKSPIPYSHPVISEMKSGDFVMQRDGETVEIRSVDELLDFISKFKS